MRLHKHDEWKLAAIDVPYGECGVLGESWVRVILVILSAIAPIDIVECRWGYKAVVGSGVEGLAKGFIQEVCIHNCQRLTPGLLTLTNHCVEIPVRNLGEEVLGGALDAGA